jgi:hypothetical protein
MVEVGSQVVYFGIVWLCDWIDVDVLGMGGGRLVVVGTWVSIECRGLPEVMSACAWCFNSVCVKILVKRNYTCNDGTYTLSIEGIELASCGGVSMEIKHEDSWHRPRSF